MASIGNLRDPLVPCFNGYQLIGASQLVRFASTELNVYRNRTGSLYHTGLCVGGQTIADLHQRIKADFYPVGKRVMVHIGTNDLLKGIPLREMVDGMIALLKDLLEKTESLILLTVVPIPKLVLYAVIKKDMGVPIIDTYNLFVNDMHYIRLDCFEQKYSRSGKMDLVHLNKLGFQVLRKFLEESELLK